MGMGSRPFRSLKSCAASDPNGLSAAKPQWQIRSLPINVMRVLSARWTAIGAKLN